MGTAKNRFSSEFDEIFPVRPTGAPVWCSGVRRESKCVLFFPHHPVSCSCEMKMEGAKKRKIAPTPPGDVLPNVCAYTGGFSCNIFFCLPFCPEKPYRWNVSRVLFSGKICKTIALEAIHTHTWPCASLMFHRPTVARGGGVGKIVC